MFLGILTLITALTISAVAIYYSVAGLVAIFAASAVPIMIMGSVLEISKLVTAVWLHRYWGSAVWWLKTYLSVAVLVLMLITSMGIFGFLSRAHIEQTSNAQQSVAEIERIEREIERQQLVIDNSRAEIERIESQGSNRDQEIQDQIDREQERIDSAYLRIQPAIDEQNQIIQREQQLTEGRVSGLQTQIDSIDAELESLRVALANNDIELAQTIAGTEPDGDFGPNTERAISDFRQTKNQQRQELLDQIESIRSVTNPDVTQARAEIQRLRLLAESEIETANDLIARLRSQIGVADIDQIEQQVQQEQQRILEAEDRINDLTDRQYELEAAYRMLEAEVGPIKYIAEFIYGDTDQDLLEEAVRWVIILIIFVFDPLAVLLLIASQYTFKMYNENRQKKDFKDSNFVKENNNELVRSNNVEHDTFDRRNKNTDSGNRDADIKGRNEQNNNSESSRNGVTDEGRIFAKRVVVPAESVDALDVLNDYKTTEMTVEEKRAVEYQEKENNLDFHNDKEAWKADNPDQTLKKYKSLYIQGKIDSLPWEGYSSPYKQNEEQNENSLFQRLRSNNDQD
jgi:peptidoglycan hydrolase-like protein with peptidoglycan-binding domain